MKDGRRARQTSGDRVHKICGVEILSLVGSEPQARDFFEQHLCRGWVEEGRWAWTKCLPAFCRNARSKRWAPFGARKIQSAEVIDPK